MTYEKARAEMDGHSIPLLRTKLHRPPVPADRVHRQKLLKRLEEDPRRAAILVSAPAGYGKSTLVSHWTESLQDPFAWLLLDAEGSDLETFLRYLDKNISKQRVVNSTRIDNQRVVL